jgi:glutamine amidotransferase-like uncharacterized protein
MTKKLISSIFIWILCVSSAQAAQRALIYNGPGACSDGCYQAAYLMALKAGLDPVYVGAKALSAVTTKEDAVTLFKDVAVWIQPGGKSSIAMNSMTVQLKDTLKEFVNSGGGYVGFCAGAFAATDWVGTSNYRGLNFMPGRTEVYHTNQTAEIIPLNWNGKTRYVYWEGGPFIDHIPEGKAEVRATYPNGQIAAARSVYGKGRVYVTGLHPEAPQDWRDYYRLKDADGLDDDLVMEMINWVTAR